MSSKTLALIVILFIVAILVICFFTGQFLVFWIVIGLLIAMGSVARHVIEFIGAVCSMLGKPLPEVIENLRQNNDVEFFITLKLDLSQTKNVSGNATLYWEPEETREDVEEVKAGYLSGAEIHKCYDVNLPFWRRSPKNEITAFFRDKQMFKRGDFKLSEKYTSRIRFSIRHFLSLELSKSSAIRDLLLKKLKRFWMINKVFYLERDSNFEPVFLSDFAGLLGVEKIIPINRQEYFTSTQNINKPDRVLLIEPHIHDDNLLRQSVEDLKKEAEAVGAMFLGVFILFNVSEFSLQKLEITLPN